MGQSGKDSLIQELDTHELEVEEAGGVWVVGNRRDLNFCWAARGAGHGNCLTPWTGDGSNDFARRVKTLWDRSISTYKCEALEQYRNRQTHRCCRRRMGSWG